MYGQFYGAPGTVMLGPDTSPMIPSAPMQTPSALFRYGEQALWSAQRINDGASAAIGGAIFRLFSTPMSQQGQGWSTALSIAETNQKQGGAIPAGQAFDVFGMALDVFLMTTGAGDADGTGVLAADTTLTIAQIANIVKHGVLSWDFLATTIDIAPVQLVGAGGGVFGAVATTQNLTQAGFMNNGSGNCFLYRKHPVTLPGQSVFSVLLRLGTRAANLVANVDVVAKCILMGYYKTAIEIG